MRVKATYRNQNPFADFDRLGYSKTVEVDDDTSMELLEKFAKEDTRKGFVFIKLEVVK